MTPTTVVIVMTDTQAQTVRQTIPPYPCDSDPCLNGASCANNGFEYYECLCPEGFDGIRCERVLPLPCESNPCINGATCTNNGYDSFTCQCSFGYNGTRCENRIPFPCESFPLLKWCNMLQQWLCFVPMCL